MSIRFKFRSSLNFDTVEIENRPSISVGELRAKILRGKCSQQQQQGFDLIFSDALTGLEYKGDDSQIPSGSSVIVKRVPGGILPPAVSPNQTAKDVGMKESHSLKPASRSVDEFDNFGADLCLMPDSNSLDFHTGFDKDNFIDSGNNGIDGLRLKCQKPNSDDLGHAIPRGFNQAGNEGNEGNISPEVDEQMKLNKLPTHNYPAVQSANLPLELKCSLCNTFFKEAVMIPCCQHSFCEKCIRQVLIDKGRCPRCFSSKCNVEDLLPNLSLRQAIEHFLESELLDAGLENNMQKYVPDGESGIQAKDVSCAFYEQQHQRDVPYGNSGNRNVKSAVPSHKVSQIDGVREAYKAPSADFQGENQPVVLQANVHDEAESNTKGKGGFWIDSGGGDRNFSGLGGHRKGVRTCYTCGSPDHLMRDCPMTNPNPMFQPGNGAFHGGMPGYAPPYWNGNSLPPFRPYINMYRNPAIMPFNASMVPVSPFAVPPYISSMHGSLPAPGGNMTMGNMGPPHHSDHFGLQHCENKRKHSNEHLGREQLSDDEDDSPECYQHNSPERSHDYKLHKESSLSHSEDSLAQRSGRQNERDKYMHSDVRYVDERHKKSSRSSFAGRDRRTYHGERSSSGKEDPPRSSDRHSDGRHKHHRGESKKYHDQRAHCDSDSSLGHHPDKKDVKRRVESDIRGFHKKHHSYSESGFEPSFPVERRGEYKDRGTGLDSRHSRRSVKHLRDKQHDGRWQLVNGSEDDHRDEYRYHKRRAH